MTVDQASKAIKRHRYGPGPVLSNAELQAALDVMEAGGAPCPRGLPGYEGMRKLLGVKAAAAPSAAEPPAPPAPAMQTVDTILGYDSALAPITCANVKQDSSALGRIVSWTETGETVRAASPGGRAWDEKLRKARGATPAAIDDWQARIDAVKEFNGRARAAEG